MSHSPDGKATPELQATFAVDAGVTVTFEDVIPGLDGATILVGETCGRVNPSTNDLPCAPLTAVLSSSGVLQQ